MPEFPLIFRDGHLFVKLENNLLLFDTGAPKSFGDIGNVTIAGKQFSLERNYMGLSSGMLSNFIGVQCSGLLGADILGKFDHIIDIIDTANGIILISTDKLTCTGTTVHLFEFMGIPFLTTYINDDEYSMFFDTGAQVSYFQGDSLESFPASGIVTDFFPGVGQFQTETYQVEISLENIKFTLRCGRLLDQLSATLAMTDIYGIIGNQILQNRTVGFFPKRGILCL